MTAETITDAVDRADTNARHPRLPASYKGPAVDHAADAVRLPAINQEGGQSRA